MILRSSAAQSPYFHGTHQSGSYAHRPQKRSANERHSADEKLSRAFFGLLSGKGGFILARFCIAALVHAV
jgi:hypothetical protein